MNRVLSDQDKSSTRGKCNTILNSHYNATVYWGTGASLRLADWIAAAPLDWQVLQLSLVPAHGQWVAVDALPLELPPTAAWQRWAGTAGLHCYVFRASFARCGTPPPHLHAPQPRALGAPSPTPLAAPSCSATPLSPVLPLPTLPAFGRSYMTRSFYRNGKWLVLDAETLQMVATPPHKRKERISCIKFSPDGRLVAVGSADNFIDVYAVQKNIIEYKYECKGHSSFITHLDWSADSQYLQSCCGAYELLYWGMYREGEDGRPRFHPRQVRKSSAMKDVVWHTHSCLFGWPMRGIWPTDSDGTDVNAVACSNNSQLVATADDIGKVKLFSYPCVVPRARHKAYEGHSSHVTNVAFTESDKSLISVGGNDRALFQWQIVQR